jgi:hypothetical protein
MDLMKVLRKEESKLSAAFAKIETQLSQIRAAISALSTNGRKRSRHTLKGRHLSAAHKKAIREGIAKSKKKKLVA